MPAPPNRFARGSAPLTWLSVIVSLPPWPKTWISVVFATVGAPPATATAPPFTRIWPAALRLIVMLLSRLSPNTVSWPAPGLNDAVTAALAGTLVAASTPAARTVAASSRRTVRRQGLLLPADLARVRGEGVSVGVIRPETVRDARVFPHSRPAAGR